MSTAQGLGAKYFGIKERERETETKTETERENKMGFQSDHLSNVAIIFSEKKVSMGKKQDFD